MGFFFFQFTDPWKQLHVMCCMSKDQQKICSFSLWLVRGVDDFCLMQALSCFSQAWLLNCLMLAGNFCLTHLYVRWKSLPLVFQQKPGSFSQRWRSVFFVFFSSLCWDRAHDWVSSKAYSRMNVDLLLWMFGQQLSNRFYTKRNSPKWHA